MRIILRDALKNAGISIAVSAAIFFFGAFPQSGGWNAQPEEMDPMLLVLPLAGIALVIFTVLNIRDFHAHAWERRSRKRRRQVT